MPAPSSFSLCFTPPPLPPPASGTFTYENMTYFLSSGSLLRERGPAETQPHQQGSHCGTTTAFTTAQLKLFSL